MSGVGLYKHLRGTWPLTKNPASVSLGEPLNLGVFSALDITVHGKTEMCMPHCVGMVQNLMAQYQTLLATMLYSSLNPVVPLQPQ